MNRGVLTRILDQKRAELVELRARKLPAAPGPRPYSLRRNAGALRLIGEIKFRSPSAGPLSTVLSVAERARAYERAGASMVSVLCDASFFDGSFTHLLEARAACDLPLLCKEFVIDELQLDAAVAYGADAVLLIARCLSPAQLNALTRAARERSAGAVRRSRHRRGVAPRGRRGCDADRRERPRSGHARDGRHTAPARMLGALPSSATRVHLSGIAQPEDVRRVAASPADAALIGEALMRQDQPEERLRALVTAAAG